MDAREYNNFLKARLIEAQQPLENNILNFLSAGRNENLDALYRLVGTRDMLVELLSKLESLLENFYKRSDSNV